MGGVTVSGNAWDVTMHCSCPYWPWVVLQSQVMPGILPCTVVVPTAMGGVTVSGNA